MHSFTHPHTPSPSAPISPAITHPFEQNHDCIISLFLPLLALLDSFALDVLGKVATAAVVANRSEFQEGAQLEGDEPALVEAIKASLQ